MKKDLFQEIVLNLWKSYPRYVKKSQCKQSTWLYRVALNVVLLEKRNYKHVDYTIITEEITELQQDNNNDETKKRLYELIEKLNEEEQAIIYLYLEEKSHQEIADIIGISISNVGTKIQRIKLKLHNLNNNKE